MGGFGAGGPGAGGSGAIGSGVGGSGGGTADAGIGGAVGAGGDAGCAADPDGGPSSCDGGGSGSGAGGSAEASVDGSAEASVDGMAAPQDQNTSSQNISHPQAAPACDALASDKPATLYQSADDSNSTASPVIARRLIRSGKRVPASIIRTWEFLNYYEFRFEPAPAGQVRIVPQLSSCPKGGELSLQVALQAERRSPDARRALNLTFVLDTSGSMGNFVGSDVDAPIGLERTAVLEIAGQLRAGDIVSIVTWNTTQNQLLSGHVVSGPNDPELVNIAQGLTANGGTDLHAGLVSGYALAKKNYSKDKINRVILISDGIANVGITDETLIGEYTDDEEGNEGIYLAGIGVGDGVNDTLMNVVTDVGRGAYIFLDSHDEAHKMLGERFLSVVDLAARSVRLEVELPWYMQVQRFYGEQISTDPTKVRPQHLGPNDAMLFFQVLRACDQRLIRGDDKIRLRVTWETPFDREAREAVIDTTLNALAGNDADLTKAAAITSYAEALVAVANLSSPIQQKARLGAALANVQAAKGSSTDPDLIEIAQLIQRYQSQL